MSISYAPDTLAEADRTIDVLLDVIDALRSDLSTGHALVDESARVRLHLRWLAARPVPDTDPLTLLRELHHAVIAVWQLGGRASDGVAHDADVMALYARLDAAADLLGLPRPDALAVSQS